MSSNTEGIRTEHCIGWLYSQANFGYVWNVIPAYTACYFYLK